MPPLKNHKHELFARLLFEGGNVVESFVKAGFASNRGNACRLKADENIQARITELQEMAARAASVDKAYVLSGLVEIHQMHKVENPTAAAKCLELLGKTDGLKMFTDKSEQRSIKALADLTEDEILLIAADIKARQVPDEPAPVEPTTLKVVNGKGNG